MKAWKIIGVAPTVRPLVAGLLLVALMHSPLPSAHASLLGEVIRVSTVGEPLWVELRSEGITTEQATECIKVFGAPARSQGIEVIREAQISVQGSGQNTRLIVRKSSPVYEPIIQLTLLNTCSPRFQREYTLFLDPPLTRPTPPRTTATATTARTAATAATAPTPRDKDTTTTGPVWSTVRGESLGSIARALYPNDPATRRHFIDQVRRANPDILDNRTAIDAPLPRGAELRVPDLSRMAAGSPPPRRSPESTRKPDQSATTTPSTPIPASSPGASPAQAEAPDESAQTPGRLVLEGDQAQNANTASSPAVTSSDAASEDPLANREAVLVAAIDQTIKTQLELMERLRRLEEVQIALKARLESVLPPGAARSPEAPQQASPDLPAEVIPSRDITTDADTDIDSTADFSRRFLFAFGGAALLLALLLSIKRKRDERRFASDDRLDTVKRPKPSNKIQTGLDVVSLKNEQPIASGPIASETKKPLVTSIRESEGSSKSEKKATPVDFNIDAEEFPPEAETLPPVMILDEPAEEHDSAVELADIMISFGRVQGAAETLADFIRSNPRQAVTPWLKLMEVYRLAGMRMEFDALARQLNKTFNVKAVTWENFDDARASQQSIEQMPHLVESLKNCWGTRECQAFLEKLLRDNRDGLREGFPISIIDEILTLSSVLEEQIGRYRPDPES